MAAMAGDTAAPAVGVKVGVTGGKTAAAVIKAIGKRVGQKHVRVGFLESAKYPAARKKYDRNGQSRVVPVPVLPVATVAFWNNFGTVTTPARPFFSNMIRDKSPKWGESLAKVLHATQYDGDKSLALMGELIQGQLQQSIIDTNSPPNAERTIIEKGGADKPLVGVSGIMLGSVAPDKQAYEVKDGLNE